MPAKSKAQQRFFGMVRAAQKGEMDSPSPEVSKAASSMSKSDVKKYADTKHDNLPERKESMNFTEFLESEADPLYQVEGKVPQCPPGYKWDSKTMRCLPKTDKDKITPDGANYNDKDLKPGNGPSYNVWGATGLNGDGYALEEK